VFADEPNIPQALFAMDHVVLLPHVGSATRETRQAMGDLCKANLDAWFAGKPLPTLIPELPTAVGYRAPHGISASTQQRAEIAGRLESLVHIDVRGC
jgi:hypothetical protein